MAKRTVKSQGPPPTPPRSSRQPDAGPTSWSTDQDRNEAEPGRNAAELGERFRRVALALTAALLTSRAFWPSEPDLREWENSGLSWVLLLLGACGVGLAGSLIGGHFRFRWSWTDAFVVALMGLVAVSASHALDRRPAINLAWEWVAFAMAYMLLRNLPRNRVESTALAGILIATAVAVAAYGLYQVQVELPLLRSDYLRNPQVILRKLDIEPGGRGEEILRNRLLYSSEPLSTFVLANSLAGFIVGPLVLVLAAAFENLVRPGAPRSRRTAIAIAAPAAFVLMICLLLTKSRSAYVGLAAALILLAWRARNRVPHRILWGVVAGSLGVLVALTGVAFATGRLDREVLTQSTLSLRYRWEYWQGAWGVITGGAPSLMAALKSPVFWAGVGPGNFGGPYLRYKLPQSSEEILDPHNLFLEVWATAGFWALVALVGALGFGLWNLLGPAVEVAPGVESKLNNRTRRRALRRSEGRIEAEPGPALRDDDRDSSPARVNWLFLSAGLGGWFLVAMLGQLNPFVGDLFGRWLVLGLSWWLAIFLLAPLARRLPLSPTAFGAAALALLIHLLAAGGIGFPTVALCLWATIAIGLNLREDRECSQLHVYESRVPPFVLAVVWAAVLGTFYGVIAPFWRSETLIADAQAAINRRPPNFDGADAAYRQAIEADSYSARPWRKLAQLHFLVWRDNGAKAEDSVSRWSWKTLPYLYQMAVTVPRNPAVCGLHNERSRVIHQVLNLIGPKLAPLDLLSYRGEVVKSTRTASRLNPTNSELHARLADASAEIQMFQDAATEAKEALRLDDITPHHDKKLPPAVRAHLELLIPSWRESAAKAPLQPKL